MFLAIATQPWGGPEPNHNAEMAYAVRIGDARYQIPMPYFRYDHRPRAVETDILIKAALPDLHAIMPGSVEAPEVSNISWGPMVSLLVADAATTTGFDARWQAIQKHYGPLTPEPPEFALNKFKSARAAFGKTVAGITDGEREELFISDEREIPRVYITCNGDSAGPFPGCEEVFASNGLMIQIIFGKAHLANWRDVRDAAIRLLSSFRQQPI